jgi:hypothetical protein
MRRRWKQKSEIESQESSCYRDGATGETLDAGRRALWRRITGATWWVTLSGRLGLTLCEKNHRSSCCEVLRHCNKKRKEKGWKASASALLKSLMRLSQKAENITCQPWAGKVMRESYIWEMARNAFGLLLGHQASSCSAGSLVQWPWFAGQLLGLRSRDSNTQPYCIHCNQFA